MHAIWILMMLFVWRKISVRTVNVTKPRTKLIIDHCTFFRLNISHEFQIVKQITTFWLQSFSECFVKTITATEAFTNVRKFQTGIELCIRTWVKFLIVLHEHEMLQHQQFLLEDWSKKIQSILESQLECNLNFNVNICTSQKKRKTTTVSQHKLVVSRRLSNHGKVVLV